MQLTVVLPVLIEMVVLIQGDVFSVQEWDLVISLKVEELSGDVWFMLLTNGQEIEKAEGATYKKVEDDAYLLKLSSDKVQIYLQDCVFSSVYEYICSC